MPTGDLDGAPPPLQPIRGFSNYADDTPRDLEDDPPAADPFDGFDPLEPLRGDLRFAASQDRGDAPPRSRRLGALAASALVAVLGVAAGLTLVTGGGSPPFAPQAPLPAPTPRTADVEVPEAPAPGDRVVGRLSELRAGPDSTAAVPPPSRSGPRPATRVVRTVHLSPPAQASVTPPPPRVAIAPPPPRFVDKDTSSPAAARAPALAEAAPAPPPIRASFDCRDARTPSQQMVCSDPRLAQADRRMDRAYQAALAAGAPQEDLRSEQADWLAIREDAARRSKRAVMNIYEQRTEELEALAAQGPG